RERALDADEGADAGVTGLQLQAGQAVGGRAGPGAPVALEVQPEQADRAELAGELAGGQVTRLVPPGDVRPDVVAHDLPDGVADRPLLLGEEVVDVEQLVGGGGCGQPARRGHGAEDTRPRQGPSQGTRKPRGLTAAPGLN